MKKINEYKEKYKKFTEEVEEARRYYTEKNRVYGAVYKEKVKKEKFKYEIKNVNS